MKTFEKLLSSIVIAGLVCMLIFAFTSCAPSGYGCTGRSKSITGYKTTKYGGFSGRHQGLTRRERKGY